MQSGLLLLGLAIGVLLGLSHDSWGLTRSAVLGAIAVTTLAVLGWIADGREGVFGAYLARVGAAVVIPAVVLLVLRSYA